jgi:site-specific DNA-methyltransferase (adenine-specific)
MINITNEDNMAMMARYPDNHFDLAIVDPPYGISASLGGNGSRVKKYKRKKENNWDVNPPAPEYFTELFRVSKNQIIFGMNYFNLPPIKNFLVWDKNQPDGVTFAQAELIWTSFEGTSKIIKKCNSRGQLERIHPTQKPVKIYEWLLKNYAKQGDKILDTHGGSLSIALAVHNVNQIDKMDLTLDVCELDTDYYNDGVTRYKNHIKQLTIF